MKRILVVAAAAMVAGCGHSSNGPSAITNYHDPERAFNAIDDPGLACANTPEVITASRGVKAHVGVCGPIGSVPKSVLIVAVYRNGGEARREFRAHCGSGSWNLYRDGQNWRGSLDAEGFAFPSDIAINMAKALGTDAFRGCSAP
ncbi:MAG TPA: hypothetical protein VF660_04540 [Actinomycetota bacterium]|jgi:hypothetical protein